MKKLILSAVFLAAPLSGGAAHAAEDALFREEVSILVHFFKQTVTAPVRITCGVAGGLNKAAMGDNTETCLRFVNPKQ
ncbi:MAG: hypothetical protein ACR2P5_08205 [Gammaproteobacteria bacterium]